MLRPETKEILDDLCLRAIAEWGGERQMQKVVEECLELAVSIIHFYNGKVPVSAVADELADVYIMLQQAMNYVTPFRDVDYDVIVIKKLQKLEGKLDGRI